MGNDLETGRSHSRHERHRARPRPNAANAAWHEWADADGGPYPEVSVRNRAAASGE